MIDASLWNPGAVGIGPFPVIPGVPLPGMGGGPPISGDLFTGEIVEWPAVVAPASWLLCDGALYAEAAQAVLFAVIGHTFDQPGDPVGFFRVPDIRGRIVYGAGSAIALGANEGLAEALRNPVSHGHAGNISYTNVPMDPGTGAGLSIQHVWQSDTAFLNFFSMADPGGTTVALGITGGGGPHFHLLAGAGGTGWGGVHNSAALAHVHAAGGTWNDQANWPSHLGLNYIIYAG